MLTALLLLASLCDPSSSAPSNLSHITSRQNSPEPSSSNEDLRTIQDIVWSCIATIFACTWVAIHPNLPDPRDSKPSQFLKRTGIMLVAVFAPEFILVWAMRQRMAAASIVKEYNNLLLGNDRQGPPSRGIRDWFRHPPVAFRRPMWTLAHGFYIQMGGFILYDMEEDRLIRVLDSRLLLELLRFGGVDPLIITEEDICDKSKGDFFTKLFVVLQTTWFIVQCIARWMAKLPVTELEVMTLAFACMNIITYILWWEKPQNINTATRIEAKLRMRMCGVDQRREDELSLSSANEIDITDAFQDDALHFQAVPQETHMGGLGEMGVLPDRAVEILPQGRLEVGVILDDSDGCWRSIRHNPLTRRILVAARFIAWLFKRGIPGALRRIMIGLSQMAKWLWRLKLFGKIRDLVLGYPGTEFQRRNPPPVVIEVTRSHMLIECGTLGVGAFFASTVKQGSYKAYLVMFAAASGGIFGGLHLISWNAPFPTHREAILWRVSSLYIMVNPVFLSVPLALLVYVDFIHRCRTFGYRIWTSQLVIQFARIPAVLLPLYIFARLSIIVLGFSTLRGLSPDAYKEISWTSFIPHI